MLDLEMPLIVCAIVSPCLPGHHWLTARLYQGILPTLIIVLVHFDMVPGTSTSRRYARGTTFQDRSHITMTTLQTDTTLSTGERMEFKTGTIASESDYPEQEPRRDWKARKEGTEQV
jgi:hypothetical protein